MTPTLLSAIKLSRSFTNALEAGYRILGPFDDALAALGETRNDIRALVTMGTIGASAELIDALPALGLVLCIGSGYERVDLAAARRRGVAVANGPGMNSACVADLAMGLVIAAVRQVVDGDRFARTGTWSGNISVRRSLTPGLGELKLGVLGLGDIGRRIAQRAQAFEMEVGYCNRHQRDDVPYPWFPDVYALADWCDVLVVALRAEAGNRHLVDASVLERLGPGGYLVNISRGFVVDETALTAALAAGKLAGAGLDVYEHEPAIPEALRALPNAVLTPHIGGGTHRAQRDMAALARRNLDAFFAGEPLITPVA
jgi:lactate dehydrogenase-like 2-hydroxyacid dehydrogenase